ncbi:MAG: hypothetical protein VYC42_16215 [Pseudomonadota bacterium]|nr:hypothetical protein [Pseudomonadota bacterium]
MKRSTSRKLYLGIGVAVAAVAAGSVQPWMAFVVVVLGFAMFLLLVRADQFRQAPAPPNAWDEHAGQFPDEEAARLQELTTNPIHRDLQTIIWHRRD